MSRDRIEKEKGSNESEEVGRDKEMIVCGRRAVQEIELVPRGESFAAECAQTGGISGISGIPGDHQIHNCDSISGTEGAVITKRRTGYKRKSEIWLARGQKKEEKVVGKEKREGGWRRGRKSER